MQEWLSLMSFNHSEMWITCRPLYFLVSPRASVMEYRSLACLQQHRAVTSPPRCTIFHFLCASLTSDKEVAGQNNHSCLGLRFCLPSDIHCVLSSAHCKFLKTPNYYKKQNRKAGWMNLTLFMTCTKFIQTKSSFLCVLTWYLCHDIEFHHISPWKVQVTWHLDNIPNVMPQK
jgi:hypothetical protein